MTGPDWRPIVIVVDPADPNWKHRLAAATPAASPENGAPVSFCDAAVGLSPAMGWLPTRHWRDLLPSTLLDGLSRTSYEDIRAFLRALPARQNTYLYCYLHVLADALTRHRAWDYLAESVRPPLVVLPPGSELALRANTTQYAQGLLARLLGGHHNVMRVRSWFIAHGKSRDHVVEAGRPPRHAPSGVLLVVEDGISAVHCGPALAVATELVRRGFPPCILTSSPEVGKAFSARGYVVHAVRPRSLAKFVATLANNCLSYWYAVKRTLTGPSAPMLAVGLPFMAWFLRSLPGFVARRLLLVEGVDRAAESGQVGAVLSLGETFPLATTAMAWARDRGIPDAAFTPVLIGSRPDNEDFPASRHLVYGDQAAQCMVSQNVPQDTIDVVGSPTYEQVIGRDRKSDIVAIRRLVPAWQLGDRLLVVATEALSNPEKELKPVLCASTAISGVHTVVKVHPADSPAAIRAIVDELGFAERVEVLVECNLASLLHSADLLICVLSNIAVTAALLGTPTMVPTFTRRSRPVDFVAGGFGTACDDVTHLPAQIRDLIMPGVARETAVERMRDALHFFAGPADGNSHVRVAEAVIQLISQRRQHWSNT